MPKLDLQNKWMTRISAARDAHDAWKKEFKVDQSYNYYEGKQNPGFPPDEWITVNKIYANIQAQLPFLYGINPYYYVQVSRSYLTQPDAIVQMEQRAKVRQALLNYYAQDKKIDLKGNARLAILDAFFAFGVIKTHYVADQIENPLANQPILDDSGEPIRDEVTGEPLLHPENLPINERYRIERVDPRKFFWDEDSGALPNTWGAQFEHIEISIADARKDSRYSKKVLKELESNIKIRLRDRDKTMKDIDEDEKMIDSYEIYDLKNKEWLLIADGASEPVMMPRTIPVGIDLNPYSILRYSLRTKSPYPIPPISQVMDAQRELNLSRSRRVVHRKRFNRKYEVFEGGLTDESNIEDLQQGADGTLIKTNTPESVVKPIADAPLDQQELMELIAINNDINETFGSTDQARGIAAAENATEAAILDKRLNIREGDRLAIVVDWLEDSGRKLDMLLQVNIEEDTAVFITGPDLTDQNGNPIESKWQMVKTTDYEDIQGEFKYNVEVGSTTPQLPQVTRLQFLSFLQVIGANMWLAMSPQLMRKIAEMHDIHDELLIQQVVDLATKMIQNQVQQAQAKAGGGAGSLPGLPENNPITATGGPLGAILGGNNNGGGSPQLTSSS